MPTRAIIQPIGVEGRYLHLDGQPAHVLDQLDRAVRRHGYDGMVQRLLKHDWNILLSEPAASDHPSGYNVVDAPDQDCVWSYLLWPPMQAGRLPEQGNVDIYITGVDGKIHRTSLVHHWPAHEHVACAPLNTELGVPCPSRATWQVNFRSDEAPRQVIEQQICSAHAAEEIRLLTEDDPKSSQILGITITPLGSP